jgi:transcriptional regulator with XRE-family HTH domain
MATNPVRYPNRLRECIKSSGYKMQEFAEETQIPLRTLHDYCSGKVPVPKKRLEIMAEMLGYPAEYLLPRMSTSDIPSAASEEIQHLVGIPLEIDELDKSRRELLQQVPGLVSTALVTPSYALLDPALLDRLSSALAKPSTIDDATLNYLEIRTANYWGDRHGAVVASCDLLSYVSDLLQKVVMLLEGSLLPTVRMRLCSIASKIAQLVGELFLDMGYYSKARQFHEAAITAAQEGNDRALESIVEQGEIEEACRRAIQAVTFATQIKLQKVIRRLLSLRRELEPWKDTRYVQALDSHLMPLLPPNT